MNDAFKKLLLIYVVVLFFILVSSFFATKNNSKAPIEINFLNIGQGDATLVQYLGRYQVLVDGGPNGRNLLSEIGKIVPAADKQIEIVVLTHPDKDHLAGLIDLLDSYDVGLFLENGQKAETNIYKELDLKVDEKKIPRQTIFEGSRFNIGKNLNFTAFNPDSFVGEDKNRNEQSVVMRMDFGENSFMFMGDAVTETELDMISDEENVDVDWLKVGHHGSKTSTSEIFLQSVTPRYAIISAGKANRFGHPHEEVLDRLSNVGAEILRTDEGGTITVECFGLGEGCVVR
ncbi:MAG: ComEC/Rec2 family competence protein [Patescibacteria group bacterium]|nr:ComEC/Rec2 family competence protein [Patescibacteria group bacterium]